MSSSSILAGQVGMSGRRSWWRIRIVTSVVSLVGLPLLAYGQRCEVDANHVGDVRIGASKMELLAELSSRYAVTDAAQHGAAPAIVARWRSGPANGKPAVVVSLDADRAFLIDSYEPCATREGVGPGATLGRAREIYGRGKIDPTELGYFIWFERKKGVMFLLDDRDVPASLRKIPDDVITPGDEAKILSLRKARIVAARVAGQQN